ncbi:hypothetical protein P7K49_015554 [Saguinus oedipus]|uniref:Uncharacterized protein n=1 Tax=Saguinus oedipus TaxID=9490 RepID=A0ABQ9V9K8_SAGOE|nr:hypothetical protein P7K49_015554 [Saguinus oedipus]
MPLLFLDTPGPYENQCKPVQEAGDPGKPPITTEKTGKECKAEDAAQAGPVASRAGFPHGATLLQSKAFHRSLQPPYKKSQEEQEALGTVPMAGCGGGLEEAIRQGPAQSSTVPVARLPTRKTLRTKLLLQQRVLESKLICLQTPLQIERSNSCTATPLQGPPPSPGGIGGSSKLGCWAERGSDHPALPREKQGIGSGTGTFVKLWPQRPSAGPPPEAEERATWWRVHDGERGADFSKETQAELQQEGHRQKRGIRCVDKNSGSVPGRPRRRSTSALRQPYPRAGSLCASCAHPSDAGVKKMTLDNVDSEDPQAGRMGSTGEGALGVRLPRKELALWPGQRGPLGAVAWETRASLEKPLDSMGGGRPQTQSPAPFLLLPLLLPSQPPDTLTPLSPAIQPSRRSKEAEVLEEATCHQLN